MSLPQYLDNILRTKRQREIVAEHPSFCRGAVSSFRFLLTQHAFQLHEIECQRHELWISFRKEMRVPHATSKQVDTFLQVSIETEYYAQTYGAISLHSSNCANSVLSELDFAKIAEDYQPIERPSLCEAGLTLSEQLERLKMVSFLVQENWPDIVTRLTQSIPTERTVD